MNHKDHVSLLQDGIPKEGGVWADLGSGAGAFTLALADILGTNGRIYSVDRNSLALRRQEHYMVALYPNVRLHYLNLDFTLPLPLDKETLDGIVMANSLHFLPEKDDTLKLVRSYLKPSGRLIIVEYNRDRGNIWVPHPFSYATWEDLSQRAGFTHTRQLSARPSSFMGEIYSAVSWTNVESPSPEG